VPKKKRHQKKRRRAMSQGELFALAGLYPVRLPVEKHRPLDLNLRIKTLLGQALRECADSAAVIAARMTELGCEITADALYAYTAPSKPDHDIGIARLKAFVRATGATWFWGALLEDDGLVVLEGREAHFAQLGAMEQEQARLATEIRRMKRNLDRQPVEVPAHRRRR
jgi:hypothetical protein